MPLPIMSTVTDLEYDSQGRLIAFKGKFKGSLRQNNIFQFSTPDSIAMADYLGLDWVN